MRGTIIFIFLAVFIINETKAQSGPAGVGTSTNNVLWLKADAGASSNTDGTAINAWNDQSGNAIHVSQSNTNQQPLYRNNVLNGFPGIEFDNVNTTGHNDFLTAPDNVLLDNTNGYTFFSVTKMKDLDGTARSIVSKRTAVDADEAFMLFYYTSRYAYLDIDGTGNRINTGTAAYTNNIGYIIDGLYDGTLPSASRSKLYEGETLRKTGTESSAVVLNKTSPLLVGATHAADNRAFAGYISEVIIYRTALNDASRIIINNYLSAKYDVALSTNDKYSGDNTANGDYDREVAGIGMEASGSNSSFSSSVSGGFALTANAGLDISDYILAGHASAVNDEVTYDVGGMSGAYNARWQRIWYVDVTNASTNINTTLEFDMSDGGISSPTTVALSDYVLLYRSGQTGNWTELATASAHTGDKIQFANVDLTADGYYTLGLNNFPAVALPVALVSFNAVMNSGKTMIRWTTSTETGNDFFTLEKSSDGINYETLTTIDGAGNSNSILLYKTVDSNPYSGVSYYRLVQTNFDGGRTYFGPATVNNSLSEGTISVYPNPVSSSDPVFYITLPADDQEVLVVVRDIQGREFYSRVIVDAEGQELIQVSTEERLVPGIYMVIASSNHHIFSRKFIVR